MRFSALALFAGAIALGACSGGDANNDAATTTDTSTVATTPATGAGAAGTGTAMPATGTTHTVNMVVTAAGEYRFEPAEITVKQGDAIDWVMVSGGPHNVAFQNVPEPAKAQLSANMPNQLGELSSPMFMNPGEKYTVSFAGIPAGTYDYVCTPHLALGMTGKVTVTQ
jgi:plastocyanin